MNSFGFPKTPKPQNPVKIIWAKIIRERKEIRFSVYLRRNQGCVIAILAIYNFNFWWIHNVSILEKEDKWSVCCCKSRLSVGGVSEPSQCLFCFCGPYVAIPRAWASNWLQSAWSRISARLGPPWSASPRALVGLRYLILFVESSELPGVRRCSSRAPRLSKAGAASFRKRRKSFSPRPLACLGHLASLVACRSVSASYRLA